MALTFKLLAFATCLMAISLQNLHFTEQATIIDPADVGALEAALEKNNVSECWRSLFIYLFIL